MENQSENIGIFNPSKEIAREVTLQVIVRHRDAMLQAREGILGLDSDRELSDNEKKLNKVRGLSKIISAQREMINISRPIVSHRCFVLWNRKYMTPEKQEEHPFEEEDNDYKKLIEFKEILKEAELDIINAEETESTDDDYLLEVTTSKGKKLTLTKKYFEMVNGLEDLYEKIYLIMLKHKIVSAGIEEDEIRTYKEQEQEAIRRIVEA